MISGGGAWKPFRTLTGRPALPPGVYTAKSAFSRSVRMRSPLWPHSPSPLRHNAAFCAASSSADTPARTASASSTHGRKSPGARSGKVSSRFPRSPFGSTARTGTPSIRASSIRLRPRPVLPLPVMPMITACVVRCALSYSSSSSVG